MNILYKTINKVNQNFYIGVHSTDDMHFGTTEYQDPYIGSGNIISEALKKYGRESFDVEVIAYFDDVEDAYRAEAEIVTEQFLQEHSECYNLNVGGFKPPIVDWIGRKHSEESKQLISQNKKGHKYSVEIKKRMSDGQKGRPRTIGMTGKKHSPETKNLMSKSHKGNLKGLSWKLDSISGKRVWVDRKP